MRLLSCVLLLCLFGNVHAVEALLSEGLSSCYTACSIYAGGTPRDFDSDEDADLAACDAEYSSQDVVAKAADDVGTENGPSAEGETKNFLYSRRGVVRSDADEVIMVTVAGDKDVTFGVTVKIEDGLDPSSSANSMSGESKFGDTGIVWKLEGDDSDPELKVTLYNDGQNMGSDYPAPTLSGGVYTFTYVVTIEDTCTSTNFNSHSYLRMDVQDYDCYGVTWLYW